jgi:16S rRNA (guanine527-N7)-methyltransferase
MRAENVKGDFDFIVSRAVTNMPDFVHGWKPKSKEQQTRIENGILYLKGGDLTEELKDFQSYWIQFSWFFRRWIFETKKVVHLPLKFTV